VSDKPAGLTLRQVRHPAVEPGQAFRVVSGTVEVGSIGLQQGAQQRRFWSWGIDVFEPVPFPTHGETDSRDQAMADFRAAWELFAADPLRLERFFQSRAAIKERMKLWRPVD
jgi:hypothetical protein